MSDRRNGGQKERTTYTNHEERHKYIKKDIKKDRKKELAQERKTHIRNYR